jgi:hypothetical protein
MSREICYKNVFIIVAVIKVIYMLWITISEMTCTDFVDIPDTYAWLTLIVSSINQVWKSITLSTLLRNMKKCTHFEFKRLVFPTTLYFVMDFISYSICIYFFTIFRLSDIETTTWHNKILLSLYLLGFP